MKRIIPFFLLLVWSASSFSQQTNPSPVLTKQDYLQKSKNQKKAAWWFLGGGAALTVTGFAIAAGSTLDEIGSVITTGEDDNTFTAGAVLVYIGIPVMLTSIPFFVASGKNKKRAMSLSFKNETAPQLLNGSFVNRSVPSVNVKISL